MSDADQHAFFMALALEQARIGLDEGELPIGAVLVNDGQAITVAHTCEKAEQRRLVHAELLALDLADRLRPFPGRRSTTVLYTTLEPCMMCMGACINFGVSEVHYALASPTDGASSMPEPDGNFFPWPKAFSGVLRQQSIALFQEYCSVQPDGPMRQWAKTMLAD